ncbi:MAG: hypothetical protein ABSG67_17200 [Thermoguttaceae bacterium]|jgi:hypothetical protein
MNNGRICASLAAQHRWPYLTDVLRRLRAIAPNDTAALEAPLLDRWLTDHPEHRVEQREEESREAQPAVVGNEPLAASPPL